MRKVKMKLVGEQIEETKFYVVCKLEENVFKLYHKYNGTVIVCSRYTIIGPAALYTNIQSGNSFYYNEDVMQKYGMGNSLAYVFDIDSWKTTTKNGVSKTIVKYVDEKGRHFIRFVDEDGNLFKKQKETKQVEEDANLSM